MLIQHHVCDDGTSSSWHAYDASRSLYVYDGTQCYYCNKTYTKNELKYHFKCSLFGDKPDSTTYYYMNGKDYWKNDTTVYNLNGIVKSWWTVTNDETNNKWY